MRTFQDGDLQSWEVYATAGDFGFPDHARIVFHCLSDPARRARAVESPGVKWEAERAVVQSTDEQLAGLLSDARELS
jgi:hypothetical protein